jgi:hypothetical protein
VVQYNYVSRALKPLLPDELKTMLRWIAAAAWLRIYNPIEASSDGVVWCLLVYYSEQSRPGTGSECGR